MKITTALQLVIELAEQNKLTDQQVDGAPELTTEQMRQGKAIKKARELLKSISFFQDVVKLHKKKGKKDAKKATSSKEAR